MDWTPKKHHIVKDESVKETLANTGFLIDGNIGKEKVEELLAIYSKYHKVKTEKGGMFYSLYSLNLAYRKKIHEGIAAVLQPIYEEKFQNFKSVINSYIVKFNGEESAFTLHQDSSSLDEEQYSPLSVWIPLQDTTIENGCLCVVPKSHKIFYPYRGISFPTPFHKIEDTVREYLEPINMKAGDILLFDNRLVHYSPPNNSNTPRIVAMSGLFPKEASLQNCYRDESQIDAPLEIFEQEEDFLLTNTTFFHDCTCRPEVGVKTKEVHQALPDFTASEFEAKAQELDIKRPAHKALLDSKLAMHIVSEPDERKGNFISFLKEKFL